jgi:gamma-glutamyltranspeptidase
MGADGQPQIRAQTYVNLIDHGLDIQTSLSRRPRAYFGPS